MRGFLIHSFDIFGPVPSMFRAPWEIGGEGGGGAEERGWRGGRESSVCCGGMLKARGS